MNVGQSNALTPEELERVLAAVGEVRREMALAEDEQQRRTERPAKRPAQHQISGQAVLAYIGGVGYYLIGSFFGGFFGSLIAQAFLLLVIATLTWAVFPSIALVFLRPVTGSDFVSVGIGYIAVLALFGWYRATRRSNQLWARSGLADTQTRRMR